MDWIAGVLKELNISRTLVAAVFVTAAVMHFGPIFISGYVPRPPEEVAPYLFALMVLTGFLLIFWGVVGLWSISSSSAHSAVTALRDTPLSEQEIVLLFFMAKDPTQPIDLDNVDYSRSAGTKLEFHHWTKQLENKGFARINEWDDNLISLTEKGRERALEIQRQLAKKNVA